MGGRMPGRGVYLWCTRAGGGAVRAVRVVVIQTVVGLVQPRRPVFPRRRDAAILLQTLPV